MSLELLHLPVYTAVNSAIGDAIGRGKTPQAMPNVVIDYLERPPKISQVAAVFKVLSLNISASTKGACSLNN